MEGSNYFQNDEPLHIEEGEYYSTIRKSNIYDDLNLGINTELYEDNFEMESDEGYEYASSPRYDDNENQTLFVKFSESSKKYSSSKNFSTSSGSDFGKTPVMLVLKP